MDAITLLTACKEAGITFYTGVPDSQLKGLCDTLYDLYGVHGQRHVVAANEGGAVGLAAGHYLATGHPALVYRKTAVWATLSTPCAPCSMTRCTAFPACSWWAGAASPAFTTSPSTFSRGRLPWSSCG